MKLNKVGKFILIMIGAALLAACLPPSENDIQNAIHQTQTAEYLNKPKPTRMLHRQKPYIT